MLKIVDFGVSEMFEKQSEMMTAKSAGSPAFLPPELCVTQHGNISGKAADIWSMGVSLYCLRFGCIPFNRSGVLELYEAIKSDDPDINLQNEPEFSDLIKRLLEKDPKMRITMPELREHPWVTKNGNDPLLSFEENTADLVEPPSEIEVNHAITAKMRNLLLIMKAVQKFKSLLDRKRPAKLTDALGKGVRTIYPTLRVDGSEHTLYKSKSSDLHDRRLVESVLATEGVHHDINMTDSDPKMGVNRIDSKMTMDSDSVPSTPGPGDHHHKPSRISSSDTSIPSIQRSESGEKGHAHDPLDQEPLFLGIGIGDPNTLDAPPSDIVAESPTAAEFNIYDTAYQEEVERIRAAQGKSATVYLTRRVDSKKEYKTDKNMVEAPSNSERTGLAHQGFKGLLDKAREKGDGDEGMSIEGGGGNKFSEIATKAMENTRAFGKNPGGTIDGFLHSAVGKRWESTGDDMQVERAGDTK